LTTDRPTPSPLWDAQIIGGIEEEPAIVIVEWNAKWPERFAAERHLIVDALGANKVRVEHIGSTAVRGLPAKPVIDIQVGVADVEDEGTYRGALERAGYELRVREPAHRMLRTPDHDVNVHVCSLGSQWERRHLLFRDWLRTSTDDRRQYAERKRHLAQRHWPTVRHYTDAKTDLIADIMRRAEAWAAVSGWPLGDGT
jgi:GrpB-like predicted nucleotidyltransferase (UPF0157 family)